MRLSRDQRPAAGPDVLRHQGALLLDAYGRENVCLGTVDSFLLHRLGGGHVVEAGNAARTQLLDVRERDWSPPLARALRRARDVLPDVLPSTGPFAGVRNLAPLRDGTPPSAR